jgi:hypothetical protein
MSGQSFRDEREKGWHSLQTCLLFLSPYSYVCVPEGQEAANDEFEKKNMQVSEVIHLKPKLN